MEWLLEVARKDGDRAKSGQGPSQPTLRLGWHDFLRALGVDPPGALRQRADRQPRRPPGMEDLVSLAKADAAGDFERYAAARLNISPEAIAVLSRLVWGTTAAEHREEKAKEEVISRHRAGRYVIQDLTRMIQDDPDESFVIRGNVLELAPPSAVSQSAVVRSRSRANSGKYGPLVTFLQDVQQQELTTTFEEIERAIHEGLPSSAVNHRAWWANDPSHTQGEAWLSAGWKVKAVDLLAKRVTFCREGGN
jgi:hypothetical protein